MGQLHANCTFGRKKVEKMKVSGFHIEMHRWKECSRLPLKIDFSRHLTELLSKSLLPLSSRWVYACEKMSISEVFDQKLILSLSKSEQIRYHSIVLVELYRSMYILNESQHAYWPKNPKKTRLFTDFKCHWFLSDFLYPAYYEKRLQQSDAAANEESNDVL